jgi:hypothetical protein
MSDTKPVTCHRCKDVIPEPKKAGQAAVTYDPPMFGWTVLCTPCNTTIHELLTRLRAALYTYDEHTLRNLILVAETGVLMR